MLQSREQWMDLMCLLFLFFYFFEMTAHRGNFYYEMCYESLINVFQLQSRNMDVIKLHFESGVFQRGDGE